MKRLARAATPCEALLAPHDAAPTALDRIFASRTSKTLSSALPTLWLGCSFLQAFTGAAPVTPMPFGVFEALQKFKLRTLQFNFKVRREVANTRE